MPIACPRFRPISVIYERGIKHILTSPIVLRVIFSVFLQISQEIRKDTTTTPPTDTSKLKFGHLSETLFNECIHLLLLALEWKCSDVSEVLTQDIKSTALELKSTGNKIHRASSVFDLDFAADRHNLVENICQKFVVKQSREGRTEEHEESLLELVLKLQDYNKLGEQTDALKRVCTLIAQCDASGVAKIRIDEYMYILRPLTFFQN